MTRVYDLTIVLPRYHEPLPVIEQTLATCQRPATEGIDVEIIIVNDAGDRNSLARLEDAKPNLRVLHNPVNRGKGFSVRRGVLSAQGRHVFFTDVDLPVSARDIRRAFTDMQSSHMRMLIGRRVRSDDSPQSNLNRKITSKLFIWLFRTILGTRIRDPQCPFKIFETATARLLFEELHIKRYAFDSEIIYKASRAGIDIAETDIEWLDLREIWGLGRTLQIFGRMIWDLVSIRVAWGRPTFVTHVSRDYPMSVASKTGVADICHP